MKEKTSLPVSILIAALGGEGGGVEGKRSTARERVRAMEEEGRGRWVGGRVPHPPAGIPRPFAHSPVCVGLFRLCYLVYKIRLTV